jgi:hypothetical protein
LGATAMAEEFDLPPKTYYRTASVLGHRIFYREAGDPAKSTIVHGFPASSHSYRELIDAGHFAVEEQAPLIAGYILAFMRRR